MRRRIGWTAAARGRVAILTAALLATLAVGGAARGSEGEEGEEGPAVLTGMHPAGQMWVDAHGDYAETSLDQCRPCHGVDLHGTALSRTAAARSLDADDFGRKLLWGGFQVGCWACHAGPGSERPTSNRPAMVRDVSLTVAAGSEARVPVVVVDPDGDATVLRVVAPPRHATAEFDGDELVIDADADFAGEDALTVAAWDGFVDSNLGWVSVTVVGVAPPSACPGDCDGDGKIVVGELVAAVGDALRNDTGQRCAAADGDGDGRVVVGELVAAVAGALRGCGGATPTPSATPRSPVATPTATPRSPVATPTATPPDATPTVANISFAALQTEIFTPLCASAFCHTSTAVAGGLDLTAGAAYGQLVDVLAANPAARTAGLRRVVPGLPAESFLLVKLVGPTAAQGTRMPVGGSLSAAQVERVRAWIAAGAPPP